MLDSILRILGRFVKADIPDLPPDLAHTKPPKCHLLDLPTELRLLIYWHLANSYLSDGVWNGRPSLLGVRNRQLQQEFADVWYRDTVTAYYYDYKSRTWREAPEGIVKIVLDGQHNHGEFIWVDGQRGGTVYNGPEGVVARGVFTRKLQSWGQCEQNVYARDRAISRWTEEYPVSFIASVILRVHGKGWNGGKNFVVAQILAHRLAEHDQEKWKTWFLENKLARKRL